jgi:hypothetical protein
VSGAGEYPRCGTCQHWKQTHFGAIGARGECGESLSVPMNGQMMAASVEGFTIADWYDHPTSLSTRPDFGCVLHSDAKL